MVKVLIRTTKGNKESIGSTTTEKNGKGDPRKKLVWGMIIEPIEEKTKPEGERG